MKGSKREFSEKEIEWLKRHFRNTKNEELARKLGCSQTALHRLARQYGLTKTPQFRTKCQHAAAAAAKRSHLENGTYPPKGYRIPRSEEFQFKPGETPVQRLGRRRENLRIQKSVKSRAHTFQLEKARAHWGLPQLTRMNVTEQPREKILVRHYLRTKGYIIARGSNTAYYDENTCRCPEVENRRLGDKHYFYFEFKPLHI